MTSEDLCELAVEECSRLGAEYAEARFQEDRGSSITIKGAELVSAGAWAKRGIGIRALVRGGLGFATTPRLEPSAVKEAARRAVEAARASAGLRRRPLRMAPVRPAEANWGLRPLKDPEDVPVEDKLSLLIEAAKRALSVGGRVSLLMHYAEWWTEKLIVTSDGLRVACRVPRVYVYYDLLVAEGGDSEERFLELGATGGWEAVEGWNLGERLEREAKILRSVLSSGRRPPEGPVDVVLSPELVGIIVHESCGHPFEADRILGREGAQAGESYASPELAGTRLGSPEVTIVDDPVVPGAYGFYLYDDEGVPARRKYLIKEGVVTEFLHNRETAAEFGVASNASARASAFDREPIIRMSNTFMLPGDHEFDELIEDVKLGVYIKSFTEWNIDDRRWNQRYVGCEAYLIERGELKGLVRRPVLEVTTKELYMRVDARGKDLELYAGTCGKGDPGQGMPVSLGGPHIRVRGVRTRAGAP